MIKWIVILCLLISSFNSFSQILNIEKYRIDRDTFHVWAGNIGIGFSSKKQQNTVATLNASSNVVYLSRNNSYLNVGNVKFIGVEGSKLISEGYLHFRAILNRKKFLSYEPFVQWQYDLGRGLEKRELYGFAFRVNIIRSKKFFIAANTGAMYEHEVWKGDVLRFPLQNEPTLAETQFVKSTSNISARGDLSENVYLLFVTYYQAAFETFFYPRIISELQLNFIINKYFTLNNQFSSNFDSLPILTKNRLVYSFNTSLMINF